MRVCLLVCMRVCLSARLYDCHLRGEILLPTLFSNTTPAPCMLAYNPNHNRPVRFFFWIPISISPPFKKKKKKNDGGTPFPPSVSKTTADTCSIGISTRQAFPVVSLFEKCRDFALLRQFWWDHLQSCSNTYNVFSWGHFDSWVSKYCFFQSGKMLQDALKKWLLCFCWTCN